MNHPHHNHHQHHKQKPICELRIADSIFLGYVCTLPNLAAIAQYRTDLIKFHHPKAAHVPYAISITNINSELGKETYCNDGEEPSNANIGEVLLNELSRYRKVLRRQSTMKMRGRSITKTTSFTVSESFSEEDDEECALRANSESSFVPPIATAIIIVRYFKERLLGVTCGRLQSLYQRTARLALYKHMHGTDTPFMEQHAFSSNTNEEEWTNLYGLGAGDTELILNVIPTTENDDVNVEPITYDREGRPLPDPHHTSRATVQKLLSELQFEGMVGSKNELLPRLQNLQADLPLDNIGGIIPIYRYPGNYSGMEWPTHPWSSTSLSIKHHVEAALKPLYTQTMNHCVTNLYRIGSDRIDHHSDKDLDLNREGVIVSVSLGCARIMELRNRVYPHDVARIELPANSMFVLGPYTNARFTHSVLPKKVTFSENNLVSMLNEDEDGKVASKRNNDAKCSIEGGGRISLTFRDVRTFLDIKTQRLFGQGVSSTSYVLPINEEDGSIKEQALAIAVEITKEQDKKEKCSAIVIALSLGAAAGYVSSKSVGGKEERTAKSNMTMDVLRHASTAVISASAFYWWLQRARRKIRQQREEKEARVFFSKKSASGNTY